MFYASFLGAWVQSASVPAARCFHVILYVFHENPGQTANAHSLRNMRKGIRTITCFCLI